MNISDSRFNSVHEFSIDLIKKLRSLVAHPDGLDPEDCLIFSIEHLMQVQITLNRDGLVNELAEPEEALKWKSAFLEKVADCEQLNEKSDLVQQVINVFDSYVEACNSN